MIFATRRRRLKRKGTKRKATKRRKQRKQRGGSVLNAPNGSVVEVRMDKGDDYGPFVLMDKEDAEKADF